MSGTCATNRKAWFRATREICGLSQSDVADEAGVNVMSVKRWEKQGEAEPPEDVCAWLLAARQDHDDAVDDICREYVMWLHHDSKLQPVALMEIYRNQRDANLERDANDWADMPYSYVNAIRKSAAERLRGMGITVRWRYPDEEIVGVKEIG